jgi:hypothetical protein
MAQCEAVVHRRRAPARFALGHWVNGIALALGHVVHLLPCRRAMIPRKVFHALDRFWFDGDPFSRGGDGEHGQAGNRAGKTHCDGDRNGAEWAKKRREAMMTSQWAEEREFRAWSVPLTERTNSVQSFNTLALYISRSPEYVAELMSRR